MPRIVSATEKQGSLILEVCPSPTTSCDDHPSKVTGTSGGGLVGTGPERSPIEEHKEAASHTLRPFRLAESVYDLNYKRAAAQAVDEVTQQIEERYGSGAAVDLAALQ